MTLLQISEPGLSPDPHMRRIAVGIDLGTTHSLVAAVRHGVAECLPDAQGRTLLPSAVRYLGEGLRSIGAEALAAQAEDPLNTIVSAKRLMGRALADVVGHDRLPYRWVDRPGMVALDTREGVKTPVEVSAEILATLRQRAEDSFDTDDLFGAVITVPAYFDDAQRQATKDAARLAGLNVLRLVNEPTAAALAYGLEHGSEGLYAVYDLGGGTFDISILRLTEGVFEVVATGGDSALGGDDFDAVLAEHLLERSELPPLQALPPGDKRLVLHEARSVKHGLGEAEEMTTRLALSVGDLNAMVTRLEFDAWTRTLVDRTLVATRKILRDAKLTREEVQGVVLVGGSTRMPAVRVAVGELFGRAPLTNLNPDEIVAVGAAIQANQLAGNAADGDVLLLDVIPLSLGIETMGGLVERIIERNSTIPTAKAQDFTTYQDGQTAMALHVVQGERELVADCRSLARFELRGIPPMVAGAARIQVRFEVDADGLLGVSARELGSGVEAAISVKPSYGLADDEIARMLREGFAQADSDAAVRTLREARVDADRLQLATRSALAADADLLTTDERAAIDGAMTGLRNAAEREDAEPIVAAIERLAAATESFAAARMNRGIHQALSGRSVEDL